MKKSFGRSKLLGAGIIALMMLATGCGKEKLIDGPQLSDETIGEYIEEKPPFVNPKWFSDIEKFIESQQDEYGEYVSVYSQDIKGELQYRIYDYSNSSVNTASLNLVYCAPDGSNIYISVVPENETVHISETLYYDAGELVMCDMDLLYSEVGEIIESIVHGDIPQNDDRVRLEIDGDEQKVSDNWEEAGNDMLILYSRVLNMTNQAFSQIDVDVEEFGVSWGDEYRKISPKSPLDREITAVNEHKFVNGRCNDCGITWTKFMYDIFKESGEQVNGDKYVYYGQPGRLMGKRSNGVNYQAEDENTVIAMSSISESEEKYSGTCLMKIHMNEREVSRYDLTFTYIQSADDMDPDNYLVYDIYIEADADNIADIFASKESFKNACRCVANKYNSKDAVRQPIAGEMPDDLFEQMWEEQEIFLYFMDNGMRWIGTSLEDAGMVINN